MVWGSGGGGGVGWGWGGAWTGLAGALVGGVVVVGDGHVVDGAARPPQVRHALQPARHLRGGRWGEGGGGEERDGREGGREGERER